MVLGGPVTARLTHPVVAPQSAGSISAMDWVTTQLRPEKSVAVY